jgi:hypothetical protein
MKGLLIPLLTGAALRTLSVQDAGAQPPVATLGLTRAQDTNSVLAFPALQEKGRQIAALLVSYDTNKDYATLARALHVVETTTSTNREMRLQSLSADLEILKRGTAGIDKTFNETHARVSVDDAMWPEDLPMPKELQERLAANRKLEERVNRNVTFRRVAQNSRLMASARLKGMVLNRDTDGLSYATNAINRIVRDEPTRTELFGAIGAMQKVVESSGPRRAARQK